jgi:hypothetical protein
MADIIRLAKSGSDWTFNELAAYNVNIQEQHQIFGGHLSECVGPVGFIRHEDRLQGLVALIKRLNLMKVLESRTHAEKHPAPDVVSILVCEDRCLSHERRLRDLTPSGG